jgi:CO/xanthine dehydrogenase FAD-binding subunit
VISGCADAPLEDCVTPDSVAQDYVQAVGGAVADMEAALAANWSADAVAGITLDAGKMNGDIHGSAEYRAHLVTVMAKRAVVNAG